MQRFSSFLEKLQWFADKTELCLTSAFEEVQKNVNLINFVKNFPTSFYFYYYLVAKSGIETAQNEHPNVWLTDFANHFFNEHIERLAAEYQILAGSSYGDGMGVGARPLSRFNIFWWQVGVCV